MFSRETAAWEARESTSGSMSLGNGTTILSASSGAAIFRSKSVFLLMSWTTPRISPLWSCMGTVSMLFERYPVDLSIVDVEPVFLVGGIL